MSLLSRCALAAALLTSTAFAGEKHLMHCFAFTAVPTATDADWKAFYAATDGLSSRIAGITHVWYGKLARELTIMAPAEGSTRENPKFDRVTRQYGVCMEMTDESVLKRYTDDPAHKAWADAYSKVRVEGTTTFNILGQ